MLVENLSTFALASVTVKWFEFLDFKTFVVELVHELRFYLKSYSRVLQIRQRTSQQAKQAEL